MNTKVVMEELKRLRKLRGLTIDDLAAKSGLSRSTIIRYEKGYSDKIPIENIEKICRCVDADLEKIMYMLSNFNNNTFTVHNKKNRLIDNKLNKENEIPNNIVIDDMYKLKNNIYYLDDNAAELAQELLERKDLRILLDASRKVSREDLEAIIKLVERLDK